MTTPRGRKNKSQQVQDILGALRRQQEAEVAKRKAALQEAEAELTKTVRALEILNTGAVRDFQPPIEKVVTSVKLDGRVFLPVTGNMPVIPAPDWQLRPGIIVEAAPPVPFERDEQLNIVYGLGEQHD